VSFLILYIPIPPLYHDTIYRVPSLSTFTGNYGKKKNVQNLFPRFLKKEKKRDLIISADTPFPIDRFNFLPREADTCMQRQQVCACAVTSMHAYTSDRAAAVPHAWSTTRVCVRSLGGGDWRSTPRRLDGGDKEMYTGGMGRVVTIPAHGILCCE